MTQVFDRRLSLLLVLVCLPLLFLPKINLISFDGRETAGVRIDDLFLMGFSVILIGAQFLRNKKLRDIEFWMMALIGFSLFSFVLNRIFVAEEILRVNAVLVYALRILEYFMFFYIGLECARFISVDTLMRAFFVWNLIIMVMQKFGFIGAFTSTGYVSNAAWRCCGIGSFASETGLLLNLLFCYFAFAKEGLDERWVRLFPPTTRPWVRQSYIYWLFGIFAFLILINGSRIALVALGVSFLVRIREELSWRYPSTWVLLTLFCGALGILSFKLYAFLDGLIGRSAGLLSFDNLSIITKVWDSISLNYDPIGNETVAYEGTMDMSWWIRIHKWCYALKMYILHPSTWLQGVGPGFAMAGLDGGFLRILVEYGVIGSYLFYKVFAPIYKISRQMKWMVIVFCFNMIFFDVYLAYKPMSFLFLATGYAYALRSLEALSSPQEGFLSRECGN